MELLLAKLVAVITGAEYIGATLFYFRRRGKLRDTFLMSVFLLGAVNLHAVLLVLADDTPLPQVMVAFVLFGISNILFWWAVVSHGAMRPSAVFGETTPDAVITSGPYRIVRHPIYLAYIAAFLGSAFVGNHWSLFLTTLGLFACYDWAARNEERLLVNDTGPIGERYRDYQRRSWRWLPLVW
ncbi:MAG TPA: isoprenylcysteine carboxylmethyltransferase family protein [Gemmataceae bacterium]|nr:isoprenylcysteine carboxylmethyltransferase family protein [Gemmataceae bacterium]